MRREREPERAEAYEGQDIMFYLERDINEINDDELTKGRIRTIFVQLKYRQKSPIELAEYYDIPSQVIRDIGSGKLFGNITKDLAE